jgi:excinuclease ABC subunit B
MAEADYLTIPVAAESQVRYEKPQALEATIRQLEEEMKAAAKLLEFEKAAEFRDRIKALKLKELEVGA